MTTDICFKEVLSNLRQNSFLNSPFPVLLSIEMHCGIEQQKLIAKYFKEILKDIYTFDDSNMPDFFPSPNKLKRKFIIKESKFLNLNKYEKTRKIFFEKLEFDTKSNLSESVININFDRSKKRKILEKNDLEVKEVKSKKLIEEDLEKTFCDEKTEIIENEDLEKLFNNNTSLFLDIYQDKGKL